MNSSASIDYNYHYRKWHRADAAHYAQLTRHYQRMLQPQLSGLNQEASILDVGCGMGFCVFALKALGYAKVRGIDTSAEQLAAPVHQGLPVEVVKDSVEYLRQHHDEFDLITAFDVLEHIPIAAQIDFLRAIQGALKEGGRFVCTVPNANSALATRWRYIDWTHHCSFTEHSLDFVLHNAGFREMQIGETDQRPRLPLLLRKSVAIWLLRSFFRFMRRLEMSAEIGFAEARRVPLSVNLKAVGVKSSK